jgi:hypothetical protein
MKRVIVFAVLCCGCGAPADEWEPIVPERRNRIYGDGVNLELINELDVERQVVSAPASLVWNRLREAYRRLGIPVTVEDAATLQVGASRYRAVQIARQPMSSFLDCGRGLSGPNADLYHVALALVTVVQPGPAQGNSSLLTVIEAEAKPRDVSGTAVFCSSRATLERLIADTVVEILNTPRRGDGRRDEPRGRRAPPGQKLVRTATGRAS